MQESLAFLSAEMSVGIAEDEADGGEEIALARSVAADDNVRPRREGLDDGLVLVAVDGSGSVCRGRGGARGRMARRTF